MDRGSRILDPESTLHMLVIGGPQNVFLGVLAKLCKNGLSSQFGYHSEIRAEISRRNPVQMPRDLKWGPDS